MFIIQMLWCLNWFPVLYLSLSAPSDNVCCVEQRSPEYSPNNNPLASPHDFEFINGQLVGQMHRPALSLPHQSLPWTPALPKTSVFALTSTPFRWCIRLMHAKSHYGDRSMDWASKEIFQRRQANIKKDSQDLPSILLHHVSFLLSFLLLFLLSNFLDLGPSHGLNYFLRITVTLSPLIYTLTLVFFFLLLLKRHLRIFLAVWYLRFPLFASQSFYYKNNSRCLVHHSRTILLPWILLSRLNHLFQLSFL